MKSRRSQFRNSPTSGNKFDFHLIVALVTLVIVGLIMVYESSVVQAYKDYGDSYFYIKQQLIWVVLGGAAVIFFSYFDYHHLQKLALPIFIVSFLLLCAVLIPGLGVAAGGAHRWLKIGFFTLQPAEIIKLGSIIFFAALFEKKTKVGPFLIILGLVSIIIGAFQRDLGSTVVYVLTALAMYIVAGAPIKYFIALIPISLVGFVIFVLSSPYRKERILAFLDPFSAPETYTYHISQILIALGSGGFFGLGLGQSRQKYEYIPEVTTDSIFAIVGEELGYVGAVLLILLLTFLVFKGLRLAEEAPDNFGKLLAFGISIWLGIQAVVNLGAMVALIPLTGVPLPFISYGGSALLVNLVAVGILLNISKNTKN